VDADRARLQDELIAAEQDERRRLALFLHDGPVQSLSGIALMLDAVAASLDAGRVEEARRVLTRAAERQRLTIRELRELNPEWDFMGRTFLALAPFLVAAPSPSFLPCIH